MATLSSYSANALVDWQRGSSAMPAVGTRYIALFNGNPASGGSDITSTICGSRLALSSMSTASGGSRTSSNSSTLTFTTSAGGSGTWTYIAVYDASTSGNLLWYKAISSSRSINATNGVSIAASDLTLTAPAAMSDYMGDRLVNWMTGVASLPSTSTRYLGLFNGDPDNGGTEVTSNVVAGGRPAITSAMPSASSGASTNNADIALGTSIHGNTVSYLAVFDASTSGNLICFTTTSGGAHFVPTGFVVVVPSGSLTIAAA